MFELKMTGFITIKNHQLIDGQTKDCYYSGLISNGTSLIKIQPTLSHGITEDTPAVFEIMEGCVSDKDIGTVFTSVA
jgi:hypothetical protein